MSETGIEIVGERIEVDAEALRELRVAAAVALRMLEHTRCRATARLVEAALERSGGSL
jgi:hypothetical protein